MKTSSILIVANQMLSTHTLCFSEGDWCIYDIEPMLAVLDIAQTRNKNGKAIYVNIFLKVWYAATQAEINWNHTPEDKNELTKLIAQLEYLKTQYGIKIPD